MLFFFEDFFSVLAVKPLFSHPPLIVILLPCHLSCCGANQLAPVPRTLAHAWAVSTVPFATFPSHGKKKRECSLSLCLSVRLTVSVCLTVGLLRDSLSVCLSLQSTLKFARSPPSIHTQLH